MANCDCSIEVKDQSQRKTLITLLLINATMFVVEIGMGIWADSSGLIADALDMLADAMVYGISLYAIGHSLAAKARAATLGGLFQIVLGVGVIIEVIQRFIYGSDPQSLLIMSVGAVALIANTLCLVLINKHRHGEVHMRASWIFSKNDVIANLGVIISGGLVMLLNSAIPDLIIGAIIAVLVIRGGIAILKDAKQEQEQEQQSNCA